MNLKKLVSTLGVAAAVTAGLTILPLASAAPASAMNVCHTERSTVTKVGCDKSRQICVYYVYKTVCTRY